MPADWDEVERFWMNLTWDERRLVIHKLIESSDLLGYSFRMLPAPFHSELRDNLPGLRSSARRKAPRRVEGSSEMDGASWREASQLWETLSADRRANALRDAVYYADVREIADWARRPFNRLTRFVQEQLSENLQALRAQGQRRVALG